MIAQEDDLKSVMRGTAVLVTCIAQALNESDPSFQKRFLDQIDRAYSELQHAPGADPIRQLELISWTRELLTGFSMVTGQGKPFLEK